MSGGIEEVFNLKEIRRTLNGSRNEIDHRQFWNVLVNARKKQSVIGSNIDLLLPKSSAIYIYICTSSY